MLIAAAVSICSCDKKPTVKETVKEQSVQKVKTKKKKVKKAKTEQAKAADSDEPQWDKRFLSFDIDTENVVSGGTFSGSVDISAPFKNAFDSSDISVELSVNGVSNGVSMNVPMHYVRGNSDKSTWSFSVIIPKSGSYRYNVSVKASGQNFFSPEFPLKTSKGSGL